ncbi:hypothetical protein J3F84DRAFT_66848 [Trichoderma pleuroticola]
MIISEQEAAPTVHSEVRNGDGDRFSAGGLGLVVSVAVSCSAIQERAFFVLVLLSYCCFLICICIFIFTPVLLCIPVSSLHDVIQLFFSETQRKEMGKKIWNAAYRYGAGQGFFTPFPCDEPGEGDGREKV